MFGENRITDPMVGQEILANMFVDETGAYKTILQSQIQLVEAFDEPFVAQNFNFISANEGQILLPYGVKRNFLLADIMVDEWDRFHGHATTETGSIPFVFSRNAQAEFFNRADRFDDESFTWKNKKFDVAPFLSSAQEIEKSDYWNDLYSAADEGKPGWDMQQPTPPIFNFLPKLKLPKSRVLVLGCGTGHDANLFAEKGHEVTAVDFSEKALVKAKSQFPDAKIRWEHKDVFQLPRTWDENFDLVFEHTCFCAIRPERRSDLIQVWRRLLHSQGFLLALFFANTQLQGPPFGSTEWEIRQRLKNKWKSLFWLRSKDSHPRRLGRELLILAQKK